MFNVAKNLAVLDADGVLLDYHAGYVKAWKKAFGDDLSEVMPNAYYAHNRFDAPMLSDELHDKFKAKGFDEDTWGSLPAMPGAVAATHLLREAGMRIICVSALPPRFGAARLKNLIDLGMPIEAVIATGHSEGTSNPKQGYLSRLKPALFVDDYWCYHRGVPDVTFKALVDTGAPDSPNFHKTEDVRINGLFPDLLSAVRHFLTLTPSKQ